MATYTQTPFISTTISANQAVGAPTTIFTNAGDEYAIVNITFVSSGGIINHASQFFTNNGMPVYLGTSDFVSTVATLMSYYVAPGHDIAIDTTVLGRPGTFYVRGFKFKNS